MEMTGQLHALIALSSGVRAPGTHWRGGRVNTRAGVEAAAIEKNTIIAPTGN